MLKVIKDRIFNTIDADHPNEKAVFKRRFPTTDYIFAMNLGIKKTKKYNLENHFLFIDFNKAFDSAYHKSVIVYGILKKNQGIPSGIIHVLKGLYNNSKSYIHIDKKGDTFQKIKGGATG